MSNPKSPKRSARKPSQLDRIETTLNLMHARLVALEEPFLPAIKEPEVWVPKVGDRVVMTQDFLPWLKAGETGTVEGVGVVCKDVLIQSDTPSFGEGYWWAWLKDIRPATPEEIAAHQEQEAEAKRREEEARPIKYGTMVKHDGNEWMVISVSTVGNKEINIMREAPLDPLRFVNTLVMRHEITVQPPEP